MNTDALRLLEFDTVRRMLSGFTSTVTGRELALEVEPLEDPEEVDLVLGRTAELLAASERDFRTPVGGVPDARPHVRRAAAGGGPLEGQALRQVAELSRHAEELASALGRIAPAYLLLGELGMRIPPCSMVRAPIEKAIDRSGQVSDEATPRLMELRTRIRSLRRKIEDALDSMVHDPNLTPHLQYPNLHLCQGRYVLPVNAMQRWAVKGIVHGTSDSGATLYVEPMQIVDMGNDLSEAVGAEAEEVEAVLWAMTRLVAGHAEALLTAQGVLAELDLLKARALMARRYRMTRPTFGRAGHLELEQVRHPLLLRLSEEREGPETRVEPDFDSVVPLDVRLGGEARMLVVTGPNTGGKTVALKTVGLACLMARAGLYVPSEHAVMPPFDAVHADIGDEQSIEQSLSTFSSHVLRIIRILAAATRESIVLLDELGAGTDPAEGGALAQAILQELARRGCLAIVTTHLGQLKAFAAACPQAQNACVEFDSQTLRPTYRLTVGAAGSSNALEIALRLGMPSGILDGARSALDERSGGAYGELAEQVRLTSEETEKRRKRARRLEDQAEQAKEQYEQALSELKARQDKLLADVGLDVSDELQRLADAAAALHEQVRFSHKPLAREVREVRDGLRSVLKRTQEVIEGRAIPRPLQPGDEVYVLKVHKWGKVQRVDSAEGRALVSVGSVQLDVELKELVPWGSDMNAPGKP